MTRKLMKKLLLQCLWKKQNVFNNHPDSHYKDILVNEIIEWCNQEKTEECYRIILDTIPKIIYGIRSYQVITNNILKVSKRTGHDKQKIY